MRVPEMCRRSPPWRKSEILEQTCFPTDCVKTMAYLRKEEEKVEMDYSLDKVWAAVKKVLTILEWNIEDIDEQTHHVKAKTKKGPLSYGSILLIDVVAVAENTTRMTVASETPVTTITAIIDFGQGKRRIHMFLAELAKQLTS